MQEENILNDVEEAEEITEEVSENEKKLFEKHGLIKNEEGSKDEKSEEEKSKKEKEIIKPQVIDYDNLTPEQEKEHVTKWNSNERAMYFERKKERSKRQSAQAERDFERAKRISLERENEQLRKSAELKKEEGSQDESADIDRLLDVEDKKKPEIKKDEKPLTEKDLEEREAKKKHDETEEKAKARVINSKLDEMELEAKSKYEDLDPTLNLATDLFKKAESKELGKIFKDKAQVDLVIGKMKEWAEASLNILSDNAVNLTELAYEIGQLHPNYKNSEEKGAEKETDKGEQLSDDKLRKLEESGRKQKTSASISGAGGRVDEFDEELSYQQLKSMKQDDWKNLPQKIRDKALGKT